MILGPPPSERSRSTGFRLRRLPGRSTGVANRPRRILALLSLDAHKYGDILGLAFFGVSTLIIGYLALSSGQVPRPLGVLLVLAGTGYLVDTFSFFLIPGYGGSASPIVLASRWSPRSGSPSGCSPAVGASTTSPSAPRFRLLHPLMRTDWSERRPEHPRDHPVSTPGSPPWHAVGRTEPERGRSADVAVSDAVETDRHERCGRGEQHEQREGVHRFGGRERYVLERGEIDGPSG